MGEILVDNDNAVEITNLKIQLEAVRDNIIVVMDQYKSGFECKTCGGTGKVKSSVVAGAEKDCTDCGGKGALLVVPEISKSLPTLGTVVSLGPETEWMKYKKELAFIKYTYPDFNTIRENEFVQEERRRLNRLEKSILIRPGAKVLFQPHVGTLIPFKGNIRLKIMRVHEPLCVIYGSDIDTKDFLDFDVPFEQRF